MPSIRHSSVLSLGILLALPLCEASPWVVIVAGSKGYMNYRHQANACHAYHVARHRGVREEQIIMMSFNDVATCEENPFPGKLFNKPDPEGKGFDVKAGCNVDYEGADVTRENFLGVLMGNGTGKVLNTTANDDVFVYFVSHGVPGVSQFPSLDGVGELPGPSLHKEALHSTLAWMQSQGKFRRLVYYVETCYSGSMFENFSVPGVYAVTSANASQSGWGTYCSEEHNDVVNGRALNTCIGDGFGVSWMEAADVDNNKQETLREQYQIITRRYNKSQVLQFGDLTFLDEQLAFFPSQLQSAAADSEKTVIV